MVEESGCKTFLKERLALDGPFQAVHLTCHGDIDRDLGPILALETPEGRTDKVTPGELIKTLGEKKAHLVFVSACRTAELEPDPAAKIEGKAIEPYVRALVRSGAANVLGWDGSVSDRDAISFATVFYRELASYQSVPFAAAAARAELRRLHRDNPKQGGHWHLARVYLGRAGGGPLCDNSKAKRSFRRKAGHQEFLDQVDKKVPVASAREFVGRRRQIQEILRAFQDRAMAGVLVYGMGNIGKSSVAARAAHRLPKHQAVVIYDRYDGPAIFDRLLEALPGAARPAWAGQWRQSIEADGTLLGHALEDFLAGPLANRPILLIIDDLEQILEDPAPDRDRTPVKDVAGQPDAWRAALAGVIRAFIKAETDSKLLLTSRYLFTLPDGQGRDLADRLHPVPLPPMSGRERFKQWQAAQRLASDAPDEPGEAAWLQIVRGLDAAGGNPGLQEILCRPILAGELPAARQAIDAVLRWKASGQIPQEESAAQEFFQRVSFETYTKALTPDQKVQLRASTLFTEELPIPASALEAAGRAAGVNNPARAVGRLAGLGLMDFWGEILGAPHLSANPLARPLAGHRLTEKETADLAAAAIGPLAKAWLDSDGDFPIDPRGVEAARLALAGNAAPEVFEKAALAAGAFLFDYKHQAKEALEILEAALARVEAAGKPPDLRFLMLASDCAERIGEAGRQIELLEKGLGIQTDAQLLMAQLIAKHAETVLAKDDPKKALETLHKAAALFKEAGDERSDAVTSGKIADILQSRGELEEALRIRQEEELPVYERLGDVREKAVTMGKIADILFRRGELEEALRLRQEEELPVYERLGELRSKAVTMGNIADILFSRGDYEEALRIRQEEQLPVYERLGDVRGKAVTMGKIADILFRRGELEEALRLRQEEELPVYERLGDVRSKAVTMGKIADILESRGELEEALRIRQEEQLPVYERLGDVRSKAVATGKIADILESRGELDEALRIRQEEELPVYERLGDVRSKAVAMGKIADILFRRGELEEALRIRQEEELPVYERLGDVREKAVTMGKIADILQSRGELEEALRIRQEEQLPVYERLGDVRGKAVTMGKIADILFRRGELEEALRLRQEEELPVYERLGDVRSKAVTMGKIADILQSRGELEEALRILSEDLVPTFQRLGGRALQSGRHG